MLDQATLGRYLEDIQRLSQAVAAGEKQAADLQDLINIELAETTIGDPKHALLLGERAFYLKQYKQALKHYMEAKTLPLYQFFCFRACAFLFDQEQKTEKAIDFANKALALVPTDWTTVALYSALLANARGVPSTLTTFDESTPASVALGTAEFDELTQLFEEHGESIAETEKSPVFAAQEEINFAGEIQQPTFALREGEYGIEQRIHAFQERKKRALKDYLNQFSHNANHQDCLFHVLEGWSDSAITQSNPYLHAIPRHTSGGYFLKWRGKGVAINPGPHFLQTLHQQGGHIRDIDFVVVTKSCSDSFADVKAIYDLNAQANSTQDNWHIIHYYLHQPAHQILSRQLKPQSKQERNTVHCLDLYLDSPDIESLSLVDGIELNYFPASGHHLKSKTDDPLPQALGIRFDLTGLAQDQHTQSVHPVRVGFVSGAPWSPFLAEHLVGCDMLVIGIEETNPEDFNRTRYNPHSLGYFGTLSLLEEVNPRLALCCEFAGGQGDLRIELVRKLRADFKPDNGKPCTILPGDIGLGIDLTTLQIRCATTRTFVNPSQVHVIRTDDDFGALKYLAPQNLI